MRTDNYLHLLQYRGTSAADQNLTVLGIIQTENTEAQKKQSPFQSK